MTIEATELIDKAEVRDGKAIVAYSRTEAALAVLREKYKDARYDLTTTIGDKAARAARLELVTLRTDLEKKRKELKAPALEFGKKIDNEAARLTGEIEALEKPIDAQIKADEKRREDERRAREEAEAVRKKVHTDAIAKIAGYVGLATDLPSERIAKGIEHLESFDLSGFEEFTEEATATRDRTIAALRTLHAKAKAREEEAARLEAERAEQARIAAEQAETARKLKEQQDELDRQRAAIEAEGRRQAEAREAEERRQREAAEAEQRRQEAAAEEDRRRQARPALLAQAREIVADIEAAEVLRDAIAAPAVIPMPTRAPAAAPSNPTLRLGEINRRFAAAGIDANYSAAYLAALGVECVGRDRAAILYHEHQFGEICDALIAQIARAKLQKAA